MTETGMNQSSLSNADLIQLSLEQCAETLGDPTAPVFARMYERFPALDHFRGEDGSWENYMMTEILTNLMQFAEDPDTALNTIKDMTAHHQLIGVPLDVFKGMYQTLFDVLSAEFQGEYRNAMLTAWQSVIGSIHRGIDSAAH